MSEQRPELVNERINQMLDEIKLSPLQFHLSGELYQVLQERANRDERSVDELLSLAFSYGLSVEKRFESARQDSLDTTSLLEEIQDLESRYAAVRFQVHKLRQGALVEETRLAGTSGQNETFETLTVRLRSKLEARETR